MVALDIFPMPKLVGAASTGAKAGLVMRIPFVCMLLSSVFLFAACSPRQLSTRSPESLVRALYASQLTGRSPFREPGGEGDFFTPDLSALIAREAETEPGLVGRLDFDPLFDSQDPDARHLVVEPIKMAADGQRAEVRAVFEDGGVRTVVRFELRRGEDGWRISDIHGPRSGSLVRLLGGK